MLHMVDNPHNGVAFCTGSYGTNRENDLPGMIRALKGRIHFVHVRNLKFTQTQTLRRRHTCLLTGVLTCMRL